MASAQPSSQYPRLLCLGTTKQVYLQETGSIDKFEECVNSFIHPEKFEFN